MKQVQIDGDWYWEISPDPQTKHYRECLESEIPTDPPAPVEETEQIDKTTRTKKAK